MEKIYIVGGGLRAFKHKHVAEGYARLNNNSIDEYELDARESIEEWRGSELRFTSDYTRLGSKGRNIKISLIHMNEIRNDKSMKLHGIWSSSAHDFILSTPYDPKLLRKNKEQLAEFLCSLEVFTERRTDDFVKSKVEIFNDINRILGIDIELKDADEEIGSTYH